ncbi:hypothetical protein, partial [Escherichia coli]|uniref:hypothetical protein n=1 Tax=Escherichia coli TaxID=562 RepID=UPI000B3F2E3B
MYQMEKITTGVSYTTPPVGQGSWFPHLRDRVYPSPRETIDGLSTRVLRLLRALTPLYSQHKDTLRQGAPGEATDDQELEQ